jgi:DNA-binding LytR/AlgR family response regulator
MIQTIVVGKAGVVLDNLSESMCMADASISKVVSLPTMVEAFEWLDINAAPDLIWLDTNEISFSDFVTFQKIQQAMPVVFTIALDHFLVGAFGALGMRYLLNLVNEKELAKAVTKYRNLRRSFSNSTVSYFPVNAHPKRSLRILVRNGLHYASIPQSGVAFFIIEAKLTFCVMADGKKYMVDMTLRDLEATLISEKYFRVNRKYIVNIDFIKYFKTVEKNKVKIQLCDPFSEDIIISNDLAPLFRNWIGGL